MTARARINRQLRFILPVSFAGAGVFSLGILAWRVTGHHGAPALALFGFAVAWLTVVGAWLIGIQCPSCRGRLTNLVLQSGSFQVPPEIQFCPFCGVSLDEPEPDSFKEIENEE
jgi:hypothetical protein